MKNTLFVTMLLCTALILSPFSFSFVVMAADAAPRVSTVTILNGNYDDGDSPAATPQTDDANAEFNIVTDPGSDASRGKVGSLKGHVELSKAITNENKIYVSYDFRPTSTGDRLRLGIRDSVSKGVTYIFDLNGGSFAGVDINSNEWYTAHCIINYSTGKKSLSIVDSAGNVKLSPTESALGFSGTPSHIRFRLEKNDLIYIDNIIVKEDIVLADLERVTGSNGEEKPLYTSNLLKVEMTENMGSVTDEHISVTRDIDGSHIPIRQIVVNGKILTLTLGKSLQSSSVYTLTVLKDAPMKYSSTPVGQDMSLKFTTSSRDIDITDVTFTSDGTSITCVATLANATASDASVIIMMSALDADNRLTAINYTTVNVGSVDSAASSPLQIPVNSGGYVKVIGILNFNTLAPINNNIYTCSLD